MPNPSEPSLERSVEALLSRLAGIHAAEAVWDAHGRIREIHVLAAPGQQPRLVVRNVESALRAGLGIDIDRRVVSVAQVVEGGLPDGDGGAAAARGVEAAPGAVASPAHRSRGSTAEFAGAAPDGDGAAASEREGVRSTRTADSPLRRARVVLAGFEARRLAVAGVRCNVWLDWQGCRLEGSGEGAVTPLGRIQAAAAAVFDALRNIPGLQPVALDAAGMVDAHGRTYVVVCGRSAELHAPYTLTGAAVVSDSPERAAIYAALQATDRWPDEDAPA